MKQVKVDLLRVNGNAYSLLGVFGAKAREQGWNEAEIEAVQTEAMSGNYEHLVQTLMDHTDSLGLM